MVKCKITDIKFENTPCRSVCVSFDNGNLQGDRGKDLNCYLYKNGNKKFVPTVAFRNIIYTEEVNRDEIYNQLVVIRSKNTNQIKLLGFDNVVLKAKPPKSYEIRAEVKPKDKKDLHDLSLKFGSKAMKRSVLLNNRLKHNMSNDHVDLVKTLGEMEVLTESVNDNNLQLKYLPPINADANTVDNVYKLNVLIPENVCEALFNLINEYDESKPYNSYFHDKYLKMRKSVENVPNMVMHLYIGFLLDFIKLRASDISKKNYTACAFSNIVNNNIINVFTIRLSNNVRSRSVSLRDKAVSYVLVLSMMINNFTLNLEEMTVLLKIPIKKLQEISKQLRFTLKKQNIVELRLPLPTASTVKHSFDKNK